MVAMQVCRSATERDTWHFGVALNCYYKPFLCNGLRVYVLPVKKNHIPPRVLRHFNGNPVVSPRKGK